MKKITITLRELNPEAAQMWCYDLNGELTPDTVSGRSKIKAFFRCLKNPKHLFSKRISKMTADDGHSYGCIYCGPHSKKVFPGETDFLTKCHEASNMWNYELNKDIDPTNIFPNSNKYAYFKCEKGHSTYRKIMNFYHSPKCSECEKEKTKLIYQFPNTRLFWDKDKNADINLDDIVQSSRYSAYFKCLNCKYEWKSQVILWNKRRYCPCCGFDGTDGSVERNRSIIEQNSIITFRMANPEDAEMWCYDLNDDMTPDNVLYGSSKKAYFRCKNGHEFSRPIYAMTTSDGKPKGCPHCKKVFPGETDFLTKCHEASNMWNYELNKDIDPTNIFPNSNKYAYFKCEKGHSTYRRIADFYSSPKCSECEKEKTKLIYQFPNTRLFWDKDKNTDINLDDVVRSSKDRAYFKCHNCKYEWKSQITIWNKRRYCPCCGFDGTDGSVERNRSIIQQNPIITFRVANPEDAEMWCYDLNDDMTPDNVLYGSGKKAYFRCENGHEFSRPIYAMTTQDGKPRGCPHCKQTAKIAYSGRNDFFTVCPTAKEMWDYNKNVVVNPELLLPNSRVKAHFKCSEGHSFERTIHNFSAYPECPKCKKNKSAIENYVHMVKQWNYEKNKGIDIKLTSASSKDTVWWKCKKCGYEWQAQISSRKSSKGLCPCCENRTVVVEEITDLFTVAPDLKIDYDFQKNIEIDTALLSATTKDLLWWKCHVCNHEWQTSPAGRLKYESNNYIIRSCPACAGIVRTKTYAEEYPELIDKFIEDKNICKFTDLKGEDLKRKFWWYCDICNEDFESTLNSMIRSKYTQNMGCPYCAGKKVKREKSFAYLHPEVMDEYDSSNIIDPYNVTEQSTKIVKWICRNNPEHKWKASFQSRAKGGGGCNICREWNYKKIFAEEHPEFQLYYDIEKNERPFNSYSNMSSEYAWWICDKGHTFEWSIANFSRLGRFECPICTNKVFVSGENDLESQYPDLAVEFDVEKNRITPDKVAFTYTNDEIWWKCEEGHEFQRSVWYRVNQVRECPICSRSIVVKGINDFQTAFPDVVKIWDYEKNGRGPDTISDINNMKFSFKCKQNHHYETQLGTVAANNFECMVCSGKIIQVGVNSLVDTNPDLAKEFSPNEERRPSEFTKNNVYSIKWQCPTCGGEYRYSINEREVGDDSCPYCHKDRVLEGYNSLVDTNFELSKEWSNSNERGPETYLKTNKSWVSWQCPTCGGEYRYPINEREVGDDSCPYCKGERALPGYNSLVDTDFELSKEWSPSNERGPETYLKTNKSWVSWQCPTCSGEYRYLINEREVGDDSCPYCKETRVLPGYNSFKVKYPDLMKEWDHINNYLLCDANRILDNSNGKVWWHCMDCNHKYYMSPKKRVYYKKRHMTSCPYCKGLRQKKRHFF